ncbi:Protein Ycf2 like [Quillaja saponaria]|uniref:Protein Ycf2 like n=1 Tax=Quillaja saponaria TaxID=32244 RepID=A0AAD7L6U5_QUISA|nr:Protein Ycf2 like [Quillaja saponaria]
MPCDPLKNYITPRPKFLQYKPNRCREIFLTQKNGIGEREDALTVTPNGSFNSENCTDAEADSVYGHGSHGLSSSSQRNELEVEDEEVERSDVAGEESDEEDEEFEGSDEEDGEIEKERGWNVKGALKFLLLCFILLLSTSYILSMNSQVPSPISQCFEVDRYGYWMIQNHKYESASWQPKGGIGSLTKTGIVEVDQGAIEEGIKYVEEIVETYSENKIESGSNLLDQKEETQEGIIDCAKEEIVVEDGNVEVDEIADKLWEDLEQEGGGNEDVEMVDNQEKEPVDGMTEVLELQRGESGDPVAIVINKEGEVANSERVDNNDEYFETASLDKEENLGEGPVEHMRSELLVKAVIGVSTVSTIAVSLILAFHFKQKNRVEKDFCLSVSPCLESSILLQEKTTEKNSSPIVVDPYSEHMMTGKCSSVSPSERDWQSKHTFSFMGPSLSRHSVDTEGCQGIRAPTVELLGEFVIGELSSSLRSCGVNKRYTEKEDINYSVSFAKSPGIKSHSVPVDPQPAFSSELSTIGSPSYGSFTPQRKIMKKEEEKREVKVITTPIRRSSRIRNRAVTSP